VLNFNPGSGSPTVLEGAPNQCRLMDQAPSFWPAQKLAALFTTLKYSCWNSYKIRALKALTINKAHQGQTQTQLTVGPKCMRCREIRVPMCK